MNETQKLIESAERLRSYLGVQDSALSFGAGTGDAGRLAIFVHQHHGRTEALRLPKVWEGYPIVFQYIGPVHPRKNR